MQEKSYHRSQIYAWKWSNHPKKRLCCCFCHIFVKDYSNLPNNFSCCWKLRASYQFEEIPLKSSLQKHNANKAMAAMDVESISTSLGFLGQNCGPLFKMRSLQARFCAKSRWSGSKTALGRSWLKLFDFSRGKRMLLLLAVSAWAEFFCAVGCLEFCLIVWYVVLPSTSLHKHEENSDPSYHTVHEQNPAVNCQYSR